MRQRRRSWTAGALALLIVVLAGCDVLVNHEDAGSLQVSIDTSSQHARSIGPGISVTPDHYVIRGQADSGDTFEQTAVDTQVVVDGLSAGYWDVTVDAYNEGNVHLYTGAQRVLVEGGAALPVLFSLAAVPGTGTLSVEATWPSEELSAPVVEASLVPAVGEAVTLDFTVVGSAASFSSDQIESGYHTLIIKLKEDDMLVAGAVELTQIVRDQTTHADLDFTEVNAPGSLQIGVEVTPEFSESLIVSIDGGEVTAPFGTPVTLTGTVDGDPGNTVFTWYVNGTAVDSGAVQTVISGDVPGHYRVDLIVVTADGSDGGMSTTWVQIDKPGV